MRLQFPSRRFHKFVEHNEEALRPCTSELSLGCPPKVLPTHKLECEFPKQHGTCLLGWLNYSCLRLDYYTSLPQICCEWVWVHCCIHERQLLHGAGHCDPDLLIPIPSMLFQGFLYITTLPNELQSMTCGDRGEHDFAKRRSELDIWSPLPTKPIGNTTLPREL